jgi:hypothetical protein
MSGSKEDPVIPVNTPEIDIGQLAGAVRGGAAIVGVREPASVLHDFPGGRHA